MKDKIVRIIDVFDKATERHVKEIDVTAIDVKIWKTIFTMRDDDHNMLMIYDISPAEAEQVKKHVAIDFDFETCIYQIGCYTENS
jgi:hypothetical protein